MPSSTQILCTGDLHLGRYPSRLPSQQRTLSVEHVWEDLITYAIQQDVDAVALTGDVVDSENATYESLGPLQRGLERLDEAEVDTVAVSGNHDYNALPRLDSMVEASRFHLLGRGGQWDETVIEPDASTPVQFIGWSFRDAHEEHSPLGEFRRDLVKEGMPTVGLLHADVDVPESVYAPVGVEELCRQPVAAWLLGHIHTFRVWNEAAPLVLYPGSLQPLDPTETGAHGPCLVEIEPEGTVTTSRLSRATVRYEEVEVDVGGKDEAEGVEETVTEVLRERLRETLQTQPGLRRLVCRLRLTGRTPMHRTISDLAGDLAEEFELPVGEAVAAIDKTRVETRPALDLERIAEGNDPPGVLARVLLAVDDGDETDLAREVWSEIEEALGRVTRSPAYKPLRDVEEAPTPDEHTDVIRRQGLLLLEELLAQSEATEIEDVDA